MGSYGHELILTELRLYKCCTQWGSSINVGEVISMAQEVITLHPKPYMCHWLGRVRCLAFVDGAVGYGGKGLARSS